jgi:hypothetical protein
MFPFGSRPYPGSGPAPGGYRTPPPPGGYRTPAPPRQDTSGNELLKHTSFSPELSFLLAMTLKDGMSRTAVLDLLRDIEPFVSTVDREAIRSLRGAQGLAEDFRKATPPPEPPRTAAPLSGFSRLSRQQALLEVMQRYAGRDTGGMMKNLQQSAQMQENFDRMLHRMERMRNMNTSSPEQMFEAMSMFMPPEKQAEFRNMQTMMRMMSNMGKNMKPEDLFRMMNNQSGTA